MATHALNTGRLVPPEERRIQPRTLAAIRWVAIAGQAIALLFVHYGLGFDLPIGPALATVGVSVLVNLSIAIRRRAGIAPGARSVVRYLAFDIVQLAVLLYLTGGLQNPFAFLLLAPVAVSATVLGAWSTAALSLLVFACVSLLAFWHLPLPWRGAPPELPLLYIFGAWTALIIGIVFFAVYTWRVADEARRLFDGLAATQLALAREQQLSAVGAMAAAAAHELGTPLGTIAIVVRELSREVPPDSPLAEDVALLREQSERCRRILAELGQRPGDAAGTPFATLPIGAVVEAAAARHDAGRVTLDLDPVPYPEAPDSPPPVLAPMPEIIHGLGNLIQNALQFAVRRVRVETRWNEDEVSVTIIDDGPGFPQTILDRLGEPYLSVRGTQGGNMGLGIFIAQTLLKRTGATVTFRNAAERGAEVEVVWPRGPLEIRAQPRTEDR
jgi:two-component system, sensor histidine kinase RegB